MLTRDLLRFGVTDTSVEPRLLSPTPKVVEVAERLLGHWCDSIGHERHDIEDGATPILHRARSLVVAKGLQKLIVDACEFNDPESSTESRWDILTASAAALRQPAASAQEHCGRVAQTLGARTAELSDNLYADLPHLACLVSAPQWSAKQLIERYNRSTIQGLLLGADSLQVEIRDADTGLRRQLLKALRFQRLLADVQADRGGCLLLRLSGPASVLDQANRYGMQLAQFVPALACATDWDARGHSLTEGAANT